MVNTIKNLYNAYINSILQWGSNNSDLLLILFIIYIICLVAVCVIRHRITDPSEDIYTYTIFRVIGVTMLGIGIGFCLTFFLVLTVAVLFITIVTIGINYISKLISSIISKVEDK